MQKHKNKAEQAFNTACLDTNDHQARCIINYLWINDKPFPKNPDDPPCGIPLDYIDQVITNAKKYPGAGFHIWLDPEFLKGSRTLQILTDHLAQSKCSNIDLKNLHELDEYHKSPFYAPETGVPVWQRVDMARLSITKHVLTSSPDKIVVYSDFDVRDIGIEAKKFSESLRKYGFVIGATKGPQQEFNLENGYFAFRNSEGGKALLEKILKSAYEASANGTKDARNDIFYSFRETVRAHCAENNINPITRSLLNVLEPCTYKAPHNPEYDHLSI